MGHEFELPQEALVDVTPEEVWQAIATGPGIDSWFMGRTEVSRDGVVRTAFGGGALPDSTITAAEPPGRLAHTSAVGEGGRFVAYEFLVEGRDQGGALVRLVTSGFLPGDDWESEYEAMSHGLAMFFATLVEYLTHFRGRTATPVTAFGPPVRDWPRAWQVLHGELGLPSPPARGDQVKIAPAGLPPVEGVVYFANAQTVGVRTPDALLRFLQGFPGFMMASHHVFSGDPAEAAWGAWLERLYAD
ncbi:SRPBCC family protein [Nonomuraea muscovyensis]